MPACCHCGSSVGPDAKVQPTTVDGETWCPRCFVWIRMHRERERFDASQTAVVRCHAQGCGWESVSFGVEGGSRFRCGHCGQFMALLVPLRELPVSPRDLAVLEDVARAAQLEPPKTLS